MEGADPDGVWLLEDGVVEVLNLKVRKPEFFSVAATAQLLARRARSTAACWRACRAPAAGARPAQPANRPTTQPLNPPTAQPQGEEHCVLEGVPGSGGRGKRPGQQAASHAPAADDDGMGEEIRACMFGESMLLADMIPACRWAGGGTDVDGAGGWAWACRKAANGLSAGA
jgi:hypothetical protein